jgi:hypothetical protein
VPCGRSENLRPGRKPARGHPNGTHLVVSTALPPRGRWPTSLDEIPKGMLPTAPLDPFDGRPLKYGRRADGVTVYSTGPDEQDNGGNIVDGLKLTDSGTDLGFRLYDPDARGMPPFTRDVSNLDRLDEGPRPAPIPRVVAAAAGPDP